MVFAGTQCGSFMEAQRTLAELASLSLDDKRIWRATQRAGEQLLKEQQLSIQAYEALALPARQESPINEVPEVACVSMDGGRYQRRDRDAVESAEKATCWREMKVGCLVSMTSDSVATDPCAELPATFVDAGKMREMSQEIKGFSTDKESCDACDESVESPAVERPGRPLVVRKSVVATAQDVTAFGPLLATAAYQRGFHAAPRKCFLADGSETNWSVWRKHFSHYTPIVDFIHALMYVYAAAMAGATCEVGWLRYRQWAQWLWSGDLAPLLTALAARQQELGLPAAQETGTPRAQLAESLGYLTNQRERMKYDEYRRQGLPITSTLIESTIKQINRRVKGTEKFWNTGIEPMLALVAGHLSPPLPPITGQAA
jgi:hypothetical protein